MEQLDTRWATAGEREFVKTGVLAEINTCVAPRRPTRDDIESSGGQPSLGRQLSHHDTRERRDRRGLQHRAAPGGERRRHLERGDGVMQYGAMG